MSIAFWSVAMLAGLSVPTRAQTPAWTDPAYGRWHSCVMGGGGYLVNAVICPSDSKRVYLHGDMDGLFRSDDAGITWRIIHGGMNIKGGHYEFAGIAINPKNADDIAVACGSQEAPDQGSIFVSDDGGTNWMKTLDAQFMGNGPYKWAGTRVAERGGPHRLLVTATEGTGVWRSVDGGRTWQGCGLKGVFFTDVHFDKAHPERIWLCAQTVQLGGTVGNLSGGEYRSEDSGKTWTKLTSDSPAEIAQDPVNPNILYGLCDMMVKRSVDLGATWQDFSNGLPGAAAHLGANPFRAIGTGPDFTLVVQNDTQRIYRLNSGQSHWQTIAPTFSTEGWRLNFVAPPASDASSIAVSPRDPNHWYMTDAFGLYQSWNAGRTWKSSNQGIETTVIHTIIQDPSNISHVDLGAADVGFWWSGDSGTVLNQTHSASAGWVGNIKCIDASTKQPSRVYAVGGEGWKSDRIYVSTDGGRSVSLIPTHGSGLPTEPFCCDSIAVDPNDPNNVYVSTSAPITATSGGVYHSSDSGKTWAWIGRGLPLGKIVFQDNIWWGGREIAVGADGTLLAISASCGSAFRFDKSSATWSAVNLPPVGGIYSIIADLLTPGRFYACIVGNDSDPQSTAGGLFRTDDSGTTWKKILAGSVHAVANDRGVKNRIAASRPDGVLVSTDGGETWTALESLPNRTAYDCMAFAGSRLIVGTGGNGAFWMELTNSTQAK